MNSGSALPVNENTQTLECLLEILRSLSASPRAVAGTTPLELKESVVIPGGSTEARHTDYTEEDLIFSKTLAPQATVITRGVFLGNSKFTAVWTSFSEK